MTLYFIILPLFHDKLIKIVMSADVIFSRHLAASMPFNGLFGFSVLVGGKVLPEYHHNTRVIVESVLWSPVTYWLTVKEFCKASEEIETQKWPVTPYEVKVSWHE